MSSLHHENILEDCFEVAMESFRINNKLTHEQLDELITINKEDDESIYNILDLFLDVLTDKQLEEIEDVIVNQYGFETLD